MKRVIVILFLALLLLQACKPSIVVDATIPELKKAVEEDPNNAVNYFNLGIKYYSEKDLVNAKKNFDKTIEISPSFALPYFGKYCIAFLEDDKFEKQYYKFVRNDYELDEVDEEYKKKVVETSNNLNSAFMLDPLFNWQMATYMLNERVKTTDAELIELAYEINKLLVDGFNSFFMGKYDRANEELTETIKAFPEHRQALLFRAISRAQIGQFDKSVEDLDSLIVKNVKKNTKELIPVYLESTVYYYLRGVVNMKQNKLDEAKSDFEACLMEDMSFYMAHSQLSNVYQQQKKYNEALEELNAAVYVEPNDPMVHYNRGVFLAAVGRNKQAHEAYSKCLELNKYNYKAAYNLAMIFEGGGNKEDAIKYYNMFLDYSPNSQQAMKDKIKTKLANWN